MGRGTFKRADDNRHGVTPVPDFPLVPAGESWRDQAACSDHPVLPPATWDDWIVEDGGKGNLAARRRRIHRAQLVCKGKCPVREACLADVDLEWDAGVRGGVDIREIVQCRTCQSLRIGGASFPALVAHHNEHIFLQSSAS